MATSIWNRKCDLIYLTFFLVHIPVMFCKINSFVGIANFGQQLVFVQCRANLDARRRSHTAVSSSPEARVHDGFENMVHHHLQRSILLFSTVSLPHSLVQIQSIDLVSVPGSIPTSGWKLSITSR